jgi:hypothetical protein
MSWPRRKLDGGVADQTIFSSTRYRKFVRDYFGGQPVFTAEIGYGNPAGTTGATNKMHTPQCTYDYHIKGAGQTLLAPSWDAASGLLFGLDLTDNEGVEISAGIGLLDLGSFTIGTDRGFYAKTQIKIADVSGTDEFLFGFRKNQAYQTAHTSYTDYAALGITTAAATADIIQKTRLNSGTAGTVDTTLNWADTETHTLEVAVKDDGYVRFKVDDAEPPVSKTNFVFDTGDVVNWFLFWLYATTTPAAVHAKYFEFGFSPRRGE